MLKGVMISLVALMVGVSAAKAQDDSVFVDLSVLNGMDGEVSVDNSSGPMFPVVKAAPKKVAKPKIKKAKKVTKPVAKAEPKAEVKVVEAPIEPKQEAIPYVETKEEVVVVDVEPVTAGDVQDNATQPTIPVAEPAPSVAEPVVVAPVVPETPLTTEPSVAPATAPVAAPAPTPVVGAPESLLIDEEEIILEPAGLIKFEAEETTLNEAQKAQIDSIIGSFTDASVNKIAIYSYNLDDGVDSFKKKRLSLNRAVEIRSYLLQKGYKNFSIKVLNLDSPSDKINSVELEELK